MQRQRVWLVTGAGRGIGRAIAEAALAAGDRVVATVRQPNALGDIPGRHAGSLVVAHLDVRDREGARRVVDDAAALWGRLDVVVNNAGYGVVGAAEEVSEEEWRAILDVNLLGAVWVTQAALPHLRAQRNGHVVQISTVGGVGAMPLLGAYNASKWALEGFSEALAGEVAGSGIRVTIAELGGFATDWAGTSMRFAAPLEPYDDLRVQLFGTPTVPWDLTAAGPASEPPPSAAAATILAHVDAPDGPRRLVVGDDAFEQLSQVLMARRDDYDSDPRFVWPAPTRRPSTAGPA